MRNFIMVTIHTFWDTTHYCRLITDNKAGETSRKITYDYAMELIQRLSQLGQLELHEQDNNGLRSQSYTLWHS